MRRWLAGSYRRCGKLPPELPLRPAPHVVLMLLVALPMLVSVATALPSWLRDEQLTSGLADVTDIVFFSDGRALVASLTGVVTLVVPQPGQVHVAVAEYLALPDVDTTGERGLLGLALGQDTLFLYSCRQNTGSPGGAVCGVSRVPHLEGDGGISSRGDVAAEVQVWSDPDGVQGPYHYGGGLALDARAGKLYVGLGDKSDPAEAARDSTTAGTLLCLDASTGEAAIPSSAGPANAPSGTYARGMRNAYTVRYDVVRDALYVGDVGGNNQDTAYENILSVFAGAQYGWPHCEGPCGAAPGAQPQCACGTPDTPAQPAYAYPHADHNAAVVLGGIVDAPLWPDHARGSLYFADYARGEIRSVEALPDGSLGSHAPLLATLQGQPSALGVRVTSNGADAELWYATLEGNLHRLVRSGPLPPGPPVPVLGQATATPSAGQQPLHVVLTAPLTYAATGIVAHVTWTLNERIGGSKTEIKGSVGTASVTLAHTFALEGAYTAIARAYAADGLLLAASSAVDVAVGPAVRLRLKGRAEGSSFLAGDVLRLRAKFSLIGAADNKPKPVLSWQVRLLHDNHEHPLQSWNDGRQRVAWTVPPDGHSWEDNTRLRFDVVATAATGRQATASRIFVPRRALLHINAPVGVVSDSSANKPGPASAVVPLVPDGTAVALLDGVSRPLPAALRSLIGYAHSVGIPQVLCTSDGGRTFAGWQEAGVAGNPLLAILPAAGLRLTPVYGPLLAATEARAAGCAGDNPSDNSNDDNNDHDNDNGSGGPAVGNVPVTGLVMLLDASKSVSLGAGGSVLAWSATVPGTSTSTRTLTQPPGSAADSRPTLETDEDSSAPYLHFDGINDVLVGAAVGLPGGTADRTVAVLVRYHTPGWGGVSYGAPDCLAAFGVGVAADTAHYMVESYCTADQAQSAVNALLAGWTLQTVRLCGGRAQLLLNRTAHAVAAPLPWDTTTSSSGASVVLGAEHGLGAHVGLDVALVAVYDRCLNDNDVAELVAVAAARGFSDDTTAGSGSEDGTESAPSDPGTVGSITPNSASMLRAPCVLLLSAALASLALAWV